VCAATGCRCHADPPQRHGRYLQYTRKVGGKTVTTRLTPQQAEHYREQIANRRRLDELVAAMDDISSQARELLLAQAHNPTKVQRARRTDTISGPSEMSTIEHGPDPPHLMCELRG
jgi:Family of unknown function (DUF6788)